MKIDISPGASREEEQKVSYDAVPKRVLQGCTVCGMRRGFCINEM
jgi:hypothetical protein